MLLTEQQQIDILRDRCENAKKRLWIVSPYIGSLNDVLKIIGGKWKLPSIDCKVLTDIEAGFIRQDTFDEFLSNQIEIRSLKSIHAKVYIIDDWCLITSANLTGTAFFCRYEMGIATNVSKEIEHIYLKWWKIANPITKTPPRPQKSLIDYQDGKTFKKKFKALPYKSEKQDKYDAVCESYRQFAELYAEVTGRNQQMCKDGYTLLQEIDYLFNFLYHDHSQTPSYGQREQKKLSNAQRRRLILKYFREMSEQYANDPQHWRLERTKRIKKILSPNSIKTLNWEKAKEVIDCLHCLSSYPIIKTKFLNPANNDIKDVQVCWRQLLHSDSITSQKIKFVIDKLHFFGYSSVYELIGWYYPDKYPLMNYISDCGMRFFGYNV